MDDLSVSSIDFDTHIKLMVQLNEVAQREGFEFKLSKGQFNQEQIELWGLICDHLGLRVAKKKLEQLQNWPGPEESSDVNSFLCFVNYLRGFMDPTWTKHEAVLAPFRKSGTDFKRRAISTGLDIFGYS